MTILSSQVLTEIDMNSVKECLQLLKSELAFRAGSDLSVKHLRELQTVTSIRQLVKMNLIGYELMPVNWLYNNLTEIMLILFSPSSSPDCIKVSLEVYMSVLTGLSETHRDLLLKVTSLNVFLVVPPVIPMMNGDELMCLLSVCERVSEGDGLEVSVRTCVRMSINPLCDQNAVMQFLTNLTNYHKDAMKEVVLKMSQSERLIIKELLNRGMKEKDQKRRNKPIRLDFSHLLCVCLNKQFIVALVKDSHSLHQTQMSLIEHTLYQLVFVFESNQIHSQSPSPSNSVFLVPFPII